MATVNPFAKAAKEAASPTKPKKPTGSVITPDDPEVRQAVDDFVRARADRVAAEAQEAAAKGVVTPFAKGAYFKKFADDGSKPEDSLTIKGNTESVKLVVQDKGEDQRYYISDVQLAILNDTVGEEAAAEVLVEYTQFAFNHSILAKEGVMEALGECIQKMQTDGILTPEEAGQLLTAKQVRTVKKGTIAKLEKLCDGDLEKMQTVFDALGSTASAYIR